jgi:predicted solute-binding protein
MRHDEHESIRACQKGRALTNEVISHYFSAIQIGLGSKKIRHYLLFPRFPCDEYFGAHSVRFWIVAM